MVISMIWSSKLSLPPQKNTDVMDDDDLDDLMLM
jgi:hypothetical protein